MSGPIVERHLEILRTARYAVLGEASAAPAEAWVVLHGFGQLARSFLRRFTVLDDGTRLVVAPEALSRFYVENQPGRHGPEARVGATWMTREDRETEIADYVRYLDTVAASVIPGPSVPGDGYVPRVVLGFSQGVATAARWTVLGTVRPRRLVLWGDRLPPDLDLERARDAWAGVDVVLVRGDEDPIFADPAVGEAEVERLEAARVPHRVIYYPGGHHIDGPTLVALTGQNDPTNPISGTSS